MKIDPRILGLLAGTAITTSACGGGVQTLEGGTASTSASTTTSGATSSSDASTTNGTTAEVISTTESSGAQSTNVSVGPTPVEDYPPPCGRG